MAVYTSLNRAQIEQLLSRYGLGELIDFEGASDGIENTTYFLNTQGPSGLQPFVLTVFEALEEQELNFCTGLTRLLNEKGLPVPCPISDKDGRWIQHLAGKPAVLVPRAAGRHPSEITATHCQQMGSVLARCHRVTQAEGLQHTGNRSLSWLVDLAQQLKAKLNTEQSALMDALLEAIERIASSALPQTVIHGDLFRDNSLFQGDQLSALIDFNSAGDGPMLLDLAVVANDWCRSGDRLDASLLESLVEAYHRERALSPSEKQLWPDILAVAAGRFWVSRLAALEISDYGPGDGVTNPNKDPAEFQQLLQYHLK